MSSFVESAMVGFFDEANKTAKVLLGEDVVSQVAEDIILHSKRHNGDAQKLLKLSIDKIGALRGDFESFIYKYGIPTDEVDNFTFGFDHDTVVGFRQFLNRNLRRLPYELTNKCIIGMAKNDFELAFAVYSGAAFDPFNPINTIYGVYERTVSFFQLIGGREKLQDLIVDDSQITRIKLASSIASESHKAVKKYRDNGASEDEYDERLSELEVQLILGLGDDFDLGEIKREYGIVYDPKTLSKPLALSRNNIGTDLNTKSGLSPEEYAILIAERRKNKELLNREQKTNNTTAAGKTRKTATNEEPYLDIYLSREVEKEIDESLNKRGDRGRSDMRTRLGRMVKAFYQIRVGDVTFMGRGKNGYERMYKHLSIPKDSPISLFYVKPTRHDRIIYQVDSEGKHTVIATMKHKELDRIISYTKGE